MKFKLLQDVERLDTLQSVHHYFQEFTVREISFPAANRGMKCQLQALAGLPIWVSYVSCTSTNGGMGREGPPCEIGKVFGLEYFSDAAVSIRRKRETVTKRGRICGAKRVMMLRYRNLLNLERNFLAPGKRTFFLARVNLMTVIGRQEMQFKVLLPSQAGHKCYFILVKKKANISALEKEIANKARTTWMRVSFLHRGLSTMGTKSGKELWTLAIILSVSGLRLQRYFLSFFFDSRRGSRQTTGPYFANLFLSPCISLILCFPSSLLSVFLFMPFFAPERYSGQQRRSQDYWEMQCLQ